MGVNISPDSSTTLRKMLKNDFGPYLEEFEAISTAASKEHSLEKAMQKMVDEWDEISFNTTMYRDTGAGVAALYYVGSELRTYHGTSEGCVHCFSECLVCPCACVRVSCLSVCVCVAISANVHPVLQVCPF